jgi:hypothetical protein
MQVLSSHLSSFVMGIYILAVGTLPSPQYLHTEIAAQLLLVHADVKTNNERHLFPICRICKRLHRDGNIFISLLNALKQTKLCAGTKVVLSTDPIVTSCLRKPLCACQAQLSAHTDTRPLISYVSRTSLATAIVSIASRCHSDSGACYI